MEMVDYIKHLSVDIMNLVIVQLVINVNLHMV